MSDKPADQSADKPAAQARIRADNLERIAAANLKADAAHAKTMGVEFNVSDDEIDAATAGDPIQPAPAEVPPPEPAPAQAAVEPAAAPLPKHRIKVHGKEMELTLDELIARAQKVEAADQYLVEAAQAYKATQAKPNPSPAPAPAPQAPADQPAVVSEDDRALARALQIGSEEDAVAAIRKLRASPTPTTETETRLLAAVEERLTFRDAASRFQSEFSDVWNDPYLRTLALAEDNRQTTEGDKRPYWERFESIGKALREWRGKAMTPAANPDKLARKATVTVLPTAAGRAAAPPDDQPEDPTATIAEMAKARQGRKVS